MQYNFCFSCGGALSKSEPYNFQTCSVCSKHVFHNSKPCSGALIVNNNKLLLIKRGIEPKYGTWDLPGGFCHPDELPDAATVRECFEETGLNVQIKELVHIEIDDYNYDNSTFKTLNFFYLATSETQSAVATDDAMEAKWFELDQLPHKDEYGFICAYNAVQKLVKS